MNYALEVGGRDGGAFGEDVHCGLGVDVGKGADLEDFLVDAGEFRLKVGGDEVRTAYGGTGELSSIVGVYKLFAGFEDRGRCVGGEQEHGFLGMETEANDGEELAEPLTVVKNIMPS